MKRKHPKLRKVPVFKTDEEAEAFLEQDLSDLDFSQFKPVHFEIKPKEKSINLRISGALLESVRAHAKREGVPYQRFIRHALERAVTPRAVPVKRSKAKAG
ncbi:MAG TPA: BrnA antitoxin family protein [Pseudolabrys sp.]|jgi:predicted DNA binding CopG/RHH family protein